MYTKSMAKNGRVMYRKDGKLISVNLIPREDLLLLDPENRVDNQTVDPTISDDSSLEQGNHCIFCSEEPTTSKYINGATILLCDEHYISRTTGEVAAQYREINNVPERSNQQS